jgi:hypothetical protein
MKEFTLLLLVIVTVVMLLMHSRVHSFQGCRNCGCTAKENFAIADRFKMGLGHGVMCKRCYGAKWWWNGQRQLCRGPKNAAGEDQYKPLCERKK